MIFDHEIGYGMNGGVNDFSEIQSLINHLVLLKDRSKIEYRHWRKHFMYFHF